MTCTSSFPSRAAFDCNCLEVRSTVAILDNGLTINDCRFAAEIGSGADDRRDSGRSNHIHCG